MANWKLSGSCKDSIRRRVANLCDRRVGIVQNTCPLSHEDVQRMVIPNEKHLKMFRHLQADGVKDLPAQSRVAFRAPESFGLGRTVLIEFWARNSNDWFTTGVWTLSAWGINGAISDKASLERMNAVTAITRGDLEPDKFEALKDWTQRCLREARLALRVKQIVSFFEEYLPTVGHVHARCPLIAAIMSDHPEFGQVLTRKPARVLRECTWEGEPHGAILDNEKARQLRGGAEAFLLAAEMMPEPADQPFTARIEGWERLSTDRRLPDLIGLPKGED